MAANRRDHAGIFGIRRKVRAQFPGSREEELGRAVAQNFGRSDLLDRWHFKRRHAIDMLTLDAENFAACRHDRGVRAIRQERFGQRRRRAR